METKNLVNVAPSSTEGHFVKGSQNVVMIDEVNETFLVSGDSTLLSKNHTSLNMEEDCLITCQTVFDPFAKAFVKSMD
jgi:hypothetical protein